jgi:putative endonuclease
VYFVYIIKSEVNGVLYKGQTHDLFKRLQMYNNKEVAYTKKYAPWKLIYFETFETRALAMQREKFFKSGAGRKFIKQNILPAFEKK